MPSLNPAIVHPARSSHAADSLTPQTLIALPCTTCWPLLMRLQQQTLPFHLGPFGTSVPAPNPALVTGGRCLRQDITTESTALL